MRPHLLAALLVLAVAALPVPAAAAGPPPHEVEHLQVPSHDGVELDGWIVRPTGGDRREKLPVVLWSAPYFGQCNYYPFRMVAADNADRPGPECSYATGDDPELWDNSSHGEAVPVNFLLEHGYAVAMFNVRGTGNSGGCFSWMGKDEQSDQAHLVEWLADRAWSNGSVGMMGLSYHGTTPWEAAIQNPPALKTIVVAGMIGDAYTFSHTPQGATYSTIGAFDNNFVVRVSLTPPIKGSAEHATVDHVPATAGRLCPDLAKFMAEDMKGITDARDAQFWEERRLISKFPEIETAVFLTHGFQDLWLSGHQAQEDEIWNLLPNAPKRMLEGQWGHDFPNFNTTGNGAPVLDDWNQRLLEWLDFWLKGRGTRPPREGVVDYQDDALGWHSSAEWPPAEAREEVLYVAGGDELTTAPSGETTVGSFRSYPQAEKLNAPEHLLCPANLLSDALGPGGLRFLSEPLDAPLLLAGNPMAQLRISSDMPGGIVGVHLFDIGPDFGCSGGFADGARKLGYGAADLRFHAGNMTGRDFPVDTPTPVRIDITSMAARIERGHRLGVAISYGDWFERTGQPWVPEITVHGDGGAAATHVVLPVAQGTLGGAAPRLDYPPRPFLPDVAPRPSTGKPGGGDTNPGGGSVAEDGSSRPEPGSPPAPGADERPPAGPRPAGGSAARRNARRAWSRRRALRLGIARTIRVDRRGRARVAVRCPRSARRHCRGTIRLVVRGRTVGRRRFDLRAGRRTVIAVRLRAERRRVLTVRATGRDAGRRLVAAQRRVRIARTP